MNALIARAAAQHEPAQNNTGSPPCAAAVLKDEMVQLFPVFTPFSLVQVKLLFANRFLEYAAVVYAQMLCPREAPLSRVGLYLVPKLHLETAVLEVGMVLFDLVLDHPVVHAQQVRVVYAVQVAPSPGLVRPHYRRICRNGAVQPLQHRHVLQVLHAQSAIYAPQKERQAILAAVFRDNDNAVLAGFILMGRSIRHLKNGGFKASYFDSVRPVAFQEKDVGRFNGPQLSDFDRGC